MRARPRGLQRVPPQAGHLPSLPPAARKNEIPNLGKGKKMLSHCFFFVFFNSQFILLKPVLLTVSFTYVFTVDIMRSLISKKVKKCLVIVSLNKTAFRPVLKSFFDLRKGKKLSFGHLVCR